MSNPRGHIFFTHFLTHFLHLPPQKAQKLQISHLKCQNYFANFTIKKQIFCKFHIKTPKLFRNEQLAPENDSFENLGNLMNSQMDFRNSAVLVLTNSTENNA